MRKANYVDFDKVETVNVLADGTELTNEELSKHVITDESALRAMAVFIKSVEQHKEAKEDVS